MEILPFPQGVFLLLVVVVVDLVTSELILLCVASEVSTCLAYWLANDWTEMYLNAWD